MSSKSDWSELPGVSHPRRAANTVKRPLLLALCATVATLSLYACNFYITATSRDAPARVHRVPVNAQGILRQCASLRAVPGPPEDFQARTQSDRFEEGTRPVLIKNAKIWTGARNGTETVEGDILLSGGVVKRIGDIQQSLLNELTDLATVDANGAWVTPGLGMLQFVDPYYKLTCPGPYSGLALSRWHAQCAVHVRSVRRQLCSWTGPSLASEY